MRDRLDRDALEGVIGGVSTSGDTNPCESFSCMRCGQHLHHAECQVKSSDCGYCEHWNGQACGQNSFEPHFV